MKKLLLFLLLLSSVYAKEQIYLGLDYAYMNEKFSSLNANNSASIVKFKIAYGDIKAYAVEFSIEAMQNSSRIFSSPSSNTNDGNKYGFNIELLKSFDFDIYVYPFVKAGFGTGYMDIKRELQNSLSYGSFNLSSGIFIPIHKNFDLELGYEYRSVSYEAIDTIAKTDSHLSNANTIFFGFNVRY